MESRIDALAQRFDRVMNDAYQTQCARPCATSINMVNAHFGMQLPVSLIDFAQKSRLFGDWFAGLGMDRHDACHIIRINSYCRRRRRTRRIPRNLVVINLGFDEDYDCIDLNTWNAHTGEYDIVYWTPGISVEDEDAVRSPDFYTYIEKHIVFWEQLKSRNKK